MYFWCMDPLWIGIAFGFGFLISRLKLPPMLGYLIAGFVLNYLGAESGSVIQGLSDLGIMLLLFTVGLKLKIKNFFHPEIWAGSGIYMILSTLGIFVGVYLLSMTGLKTFTGITWEAALIIAFAMSFSSTVFAVKVLEDKGEVGALHGKTSIGILIMQDVFAVLFMVFAAGKMPNIYAIGLPVALVILRPVMKYILNHSGHGELLILFGFFAAVVAGGELFSFTGIKADLGALVMGMLLAGSQKAEEMSKDLLKFKDVFLIGFFLTIGLYGDISPVIILTSIIVVTAVVVKVPLYFFILTRFKLRARTAFLSSLSLANFSEFGLIVAAIGASNNWIPQEWVVILALALTLSFIMAAPLNARSYSLISRFYDFIVKFQRTKRLSYDRTYDIGDAEILIFGMGSFGTSTYDVLKQSYGRKVLGLDYDEDRVKQHKVQGRQVINDDATDMDFWERIRFDRIQSHQVRVVMLCMGDHSSNMYALERLKRVNFEGMIAATANYDDEVEALRKSGVQLAYNSKAEAGAGFAEHVCQNLCNVSTDTNDTQK
jgi:glutathione-regulated potassium-efflux system ancillary protein KefC